MRMYRSINDRQKGSATLLKTWENIIILSSTVQVLLYWKSPCYPDHSICSYLVWDVSGTQLIIWRGEKGIFIPTSFCMSIKVRMPQRHRYVFYYCKQTLHGLNIQESSLLSNWILFPSILQFVRLQETTKNIFLLKNLLGKLILL